MLKAAIAAVLLCVSLNAEEISGIVVEAAGEPSAGASLTIQSRSGVVRRDLRTDLNGKYRATDLPPDSYIVTARSVRTGDSATAATEPHQSVDLEIHLSGGWRVDPPITHGQEGGDLEGYG
ncbi:MAG: carboxypeptidase-like regulatory domain-containing protein, partial [Bryobacteraceae bacterium]